jgi:hypothetical protein
MAKTAALRILQLLMSQQFAADIADPTEANLEHAG